jgi:hypothetical protein
MNVFLIILIVVAIVIFAQMSSQKTKNKLLKEVAESLGLRFQQGGFWDDPEISGKFEGCQISVQTITKDKKDFVQVTARKNIPGYIHVTRETVFTKMQRLVGIKDVETGDEGFDHDILLEPDELSNLVAFMDHETRRLLMVLSRDSGYFEINNSSALAGFEKPRSLKTGRVKRYISLVVEITRGFSKPVSIEERFAENIKTDPVPQVRINNIRAVTSYFTGKSKRDSFLREALDNSFIEVQVEAAKHLGKEGLAHLVKILADKARSLNRDLAIDIVDTLKKDNYNKSIPVLKKVYHTDRGDTLKKAVLQAFTVFADTSLHSFLLTELERESSALTSNIVEALGTCGQVEAVERLYKIGKSRFSPVIRSTVKEAIARIQSRLGDVEKGWLSVSQLQDAEGALSLADEAGKGALSTPGEKQDERGEK